MFTLFWGKVLQKLFYSLFSLFFSNPNIIMQIKKQTKKLIKLDSNSHKKNRYTHTHTCVGLYEYLVWLFQ